MSQKSVVSGLFKHSEEQFNAACRQVSSKDLWAPSSINAVIYITVVIKFST